jgi:hypothetical protein
LPSAMWVETLELRQRLTWLLSCWLTLKLVEHLYEAL